MTRIQDLRAMDVGSEPYERIIDGAMADLGHTTNPVIATRDDSWRMLETS